MRWVGKPNCSSFLSYYQDDFETVDEKGSLSCVIDVSWFQFKFLFMTNSFWEFHPTRRVPEGDRNPSMWTARVVSWEVPDQTGVLFLSLVGEFEKSERFARAKHVLHVYGNNLEKNEKTISSSWMGLVRHWRHSISREDAKDMVIVLVNVMVQTMSVEFLESNIGQKRR